MKNFGFGCMRLPMRDEHVDYVEFSLMIKEFLNNGFTYFDTAHGYINKQSEIAIRECLTSKYPRSAYTLTNKLTGVYFNTKEEILPFFNQQLANCGVTYFDYYLMHSQNANVYEKFKKCKAYETAIELLHEGKIKHFGISFHDKAEVLEQILTEYPEIEFVQIQFNYVDFSSENVQSKKVYDVALKHNKKIIVMEPVKGGSLINLPDEAQKILSDLHSGSNASYAIRFATSFDNIVMVLSGMSNLEQVKDNCSFMKDFKKLDNLEMEAVFKVANIFNSLHSIGCTSCKYCIEGCVKNIPIPDIFACLNQKEIYKDWNSDFYYSISTSNKGKASDCIKCGKCENICPQHLPIRELLQKAVKTFEGKKRDDED